MIIFRCSQAKAHTHLSFCAGHRSARVLLAKHLPYAPLIILFPTLIIIQVLSLDLRDDIVGRFRLDVRHEVLGLGNVGIVFFGRAIVIGLFGCWWHRRRGRLTIAAWADLLSKMAVQSCPSATDSHGCEVQIELTQP